MKTLCILTVSLLLTLTGCAHYISEQSRSQADPTITFRMLRENAVAYRGKLVMLGGIVAALSQSEEGTSIEVIQYPLNSRELPEQVHPPGGRFLAVTHESIDPASYRPGVLVSMMGEVTGTKVQPLAGRDYTYPVIAVKEIHVLEFEDLYPPWGYLGGNGHGHR